MSLSTARTNVTKGQTSLSKLCDETTVQLQSWKALPKDQLLQEKEALEECEFKLEQRQTRLKESMGILDATVDNLSLEEEDHDKHAEYAVKYSEIMDRAAEIMDDIRFQLRRTEISARTERSSYSSVRDTPQQAEEHGNQHVENQQTIYQFQPSVGIKLLDLPTIPTFTGNCWEFKNFMTLFEEIVDRSKQNDFFKLNHLHEHLSGPPLKLVKRYQLVGDNYSKSIAALKKKYGNVGNTLTDLAEQLENENAKSEATEHQQDLLDNISVILEQMLELGEPIDTMSNKREVLKKFAFRIKKEAYTKKLQVKDQEWTMEKVLKDLSDIISREEELKKFLPKQEKKDFNKKSDKDDKKKPFSSQNQHSKKSPSTKSSTREKHCIFCPSKDHWGSECTVLKTPQERLEFIRKDERCIKCTRRGHRKEDCNRSCSICSKDHHFSLCFKQAADSKPAAASSKSTVSTSFNKDKTKRNTHATVSQGRLAGDSDEDEEEAEAGLEIESKQAAAITRQRTTAYIPTLKGNAFNPKKGCWESITVMMDSGSDQTYITEELLEKFQLPDRGSASINTRTFGSSKAQQIRFGKSMIKIKTPTKKILEMEVFVSKHLTGKLAKAPLSKEDMKYLLEKGATVNPQCLEEEVTPDLLLGCDYWHMFITDEHFKLPSGLQAMGTVLGLTTMGTTQSKPKTTTSGKTTCMVMEDISQDAIFLAEKEQIADMKMKEDNEFSGPLKQEESAADEATVKFFNETIEKRGPSYCVRLPLKEEHPKLPNNFNVSYSRLKQLIQKQPKEVLKAVDAVFEEQEQRKYIEKVPLSLENNGKIRYNPIQAVVTPQKTTTKVRVVVDGSSRTRNTISLNDIIKKGPTILPDMIGMLLRFRAGATAIISDVEKAFLQVLLHETDRDFTRVLWVKDFNQPVAHDNLIVYRFTRVLFGLNVSPFLLGATILHHLKSMENQSLANQMANNTFVDNVIITTDSTPIEAIEIYKTIKTTFSDAGMNIREFRSNSEIFNSMVEASDLSKEEVLKVLGVWWRSNEDKIEMKAFIEETMKDTRSTVARAVAAVFDPLGLLVPLLLPAKLFQRDNLWDTKYDWKTGLTVEDQGNWEKVAENISGFEIQLPRQVINKSGLNSIITFCDASKEAAGYCIYIKNDLGVHIVFGKSKVRPLKEPWTIPKLETHALSIGTEKTLEVFKALDTDGIQVDQVIIMTDSSIALDWLRSTPHKKDAGQLVTRRLKKIRLATSEMEDAGIPVKFGHVRSEDNPADLATRGCDKSTFANTIWWNGPSFAREAIEDWPKEAKLFQLETTEHTLCHIMSSPAQPQQSEVFDCENTNNFYKMKRVVVRILKFIKMRFSKLPSPKMDRLEEAIPELKLIKPTASMDAEELQQAENVLIKDHQKSITPEQLLKMRNLGIVKNKAGLLVCKGRMSKAKMEDSAKFPILIQPNSKLAKLIIQDGHLPYHHPMDHTMDKIRRKFWIPQLRRHVKSWTQHCVPCQRLNKPPLKYPQMADLPSARVNKARPFGNIGLDNFGPIPFKKEDGSTGSAYGTIFTCAVTRLIHVEIAQDMSALEFINAFRRFGALRGFPDKIISDNGTNFVLAQKIIEESYKGKVPPEALQRIEWGFITPYSPWKGGFYERMVKSAKHTFMKTIGKQLLTFPELVVSYYEICAAINSRPLTYPEDDINSGHPIRPQDFVNQEMKVTIPLEDVLDSTDDYSPSAEAQSAETKLKTIEAFKSSVKRTTKMWDTWQTKYLSELREHHKLHMNNKRGSRNLPRIGQAVLLMDENQHRSKWKLGTIEKIIISKDDVVREVEIKGPNGNILNRSINMFVPLELDEPDSEEETDEPTKQDDSTKSSNDPVQGRYNLRTRKAVNYDDDRELHSFSTNSAIPTWWSSISLCLMLLFTFFSGAGATNTNTSMDCNHQGVQLHGNVKEFEVCSENFCTSSFRWSWNERQVWLPPSIKIHPHHITAKINDGQDLTILEHDCPPVDYCQTIDCTICISNIVNPECHIYSAIIGICAILFCIMFVIHATCNSPIKLGDVFKLGWSIMKTTMLTMARTLIWIFSKCRRGRNRRAKWRQIIVIVTILQCISTTQSCQEVDMLSQFENVCDQDGNCQVLTEEIVHLNQAHREGCIRVDKNGTVMRDIRVEFLEIEMKCSKKSILYTQDVETRVWSTKRCPNMGSCKGTKCANVTRRSTITELNEVNHYVGNTGCSESCGGPGCGCFYLSSGCIFYRIYALPKSNDTFELFNCIEYQTLATLKITVTSLNTFKNKAESLTITTPIGKSIPYQDMVVTVDSIQVPQSPLLNSWFIKKEKEVATWPEYTLPNFRCNANLQDCTLIEDCKCTPAEDQMRCTCTDSEIGDILKKTNRRLPVQLGHFRLEATKDDVKARIRNTGTTIVSIKITDKWKSTIVKTKEHCEATATNIDGCYSCSKGGTSEITCTSRFEDTMATVDCEKEIFTVECRPNGATTKITFQSQYAEFNRRCELNCGGKRSTTLEIKGTLKYSGSIWTSMYRIINGNTTVYEEINWPDVSFMANKYITYIKTIIIALIAVGIIFLMTYTIITNTGIKILKTIGAASWWITKTIIKLPFVILFAMCNRIKRQRRHAHLHNLIIIMIFNIPLNHCIHHYSPFIQNGRTGIQRGQQDPIAGQQVLQEVQADLHGTPIANHTMTSPPGASPMEIFIPDVRNHQDHQEPMEQRQKPFVMAANFRSVGPSTLLFVDHC